MYCSCVRASGLLYLSKICTAPQSSYSYTSPLWEYSFRLCGRLAVSAPQSLQLSLEMIDALGAGHDASKQTGGVAGPTPFHRAKSWPSNQQVQRGWLSLTWHIYDNRGSYNGWFDFMPEWMRIGPWAPAAYVFMFVFYGSMLTCAPRPLEFAITETMSFWWALDLFVFVWGAIVIFEGGRHYSMRAFAVSYTGWSWCILTVRAFFCVLAPMVAPQYPTLAQSAAIWGSALRFPTLVAATVTFTVWNTMLLPILLIYVVSTSSRPKFLAFNFGALASTYTEQPCDARCF